MAKDEAKTLEDRVRDLSERQAKVALHVMREIGAASRDVYERIIALAEATPYED